VPASAARAIHDPRMSGHGRKQTPKVAYQLAPSRWRNLQPLQNGRCIRWRRAPFARYRLPGRPVQQFQVSLHRDGQEAFVAATGAATIDTRPRFATTLVKFQRGQKPVGCPGSVPERALRRLAIIARLNPPLFVACGACLSPFRLDPPLCRRVIAGLQRFGQRRADRIEIHVATASPSAAKPDCSSVHPTRTPPKRADSTTPRCGHGLRRRGIASPSASAESSRPVSAARHAGRTTARSARAQPTFSPIRFLDLTPRTGLGAGERAASDSPSSLL